MGFVVGDVIVKAARNIGVTTPLLPIMGAAFGIGGYFAAFPYLLVLGAVLCGLNELLNVASGIYKLPLIAVVLVIVGGGIVFPWYVGAMLGLCCAGALDGLGEIYGRMKERQIEERTT